MQQQVSISKGSTMKQSAPVSHPLKFQYGFVCPGELVTHHMDNANSKVGRVNSNGIMGIVDPSCRMIALHIYDAIVKV